MESRNRRELIVEHPRTRHGAHRGTVAGLLNIAVLVACLAGAASAATDPPPALTDAQREQLKECDRLGREADALQGQGKLAEATAAVRQILDIERRVWGNDHADVVGSLRRLSQLASAQEDFPAAKEAAAEALAITGKLHGPKHWRVTDVRWELADVEHRATLDPEQRRQLADATQLNEQVFGLHRLGRYGEALEAAQRELANRKRVLGEDHPDYAQSLNNLAELYQDKGDYAQAESLYRQALEIRKRVLGEDHPDYAQSLNNLAELYQAKGDYARAQPLLRQALAIRKRVLGEDHPDYATSLNNLAGLYEAKGDYAQAEPLYRQALANRKRVLGEDHPDYATCLGNLACLYQATNRPELALATLVHDMKVQQTNLRRVFAVSAEPAMRAYLDMIHSTLDGLISMARTRDEPELAATTLTWTLRRKAVILDTLCQFRDAQRRLQSDPAVSARSVSLRALRTQLNDWPLNPPRGLDAGALRQQLAAKRQEADQVEAELYRQLTADRPGQAQDPATVDTETARRRLPAGSALVELVRSRLFDFQATGQAPRWKPAHYFALVLRADRDAQPRMIDLGAAEEIDAGIGKLRGAVDQFRKTFENKKRPDERAAEDHFRKLGTGLYTKPFAPLRAALGEAALIYLAPDGALNLLPFEALVDEQGNYLVESRRFVYLSSGRDLLRPAAAPARGTVIFADPDFDLDAADRRKVARALLDALAAKPGSSLRVHAPHIDLSQRLTAAPSAPRLSTRGTRSDELRGLKWESLKNFGPEADEIEKELAGSGYGPVTVYRGKEALEDVFKALPAPRVLHMITHGKYLPNRVDPEDRVRPVAVVPGLGMGRGFGRLQVMEDPLFRSWLVLAGANKLSEDEDQPDAAVDDGWLTAGEIAALDLRGTELVVLSACDTGRGDVRGGEGVYGLRRAFLYAGARTLVTSLFPVPDEQTRELMGQFYRSLKEGRGKLSALHEAQLALIRQRRQSGGAAHPFFWASFVLVGDPD